MISRANDLGVGGLDNRRHSPAEHLIHVIDYARILKNGISYALHLCWRRGLRSVGLMLTKQASTMGPPSVAETKVFFDLSISAGGSIRERSMARFASAKDGINAGTRRANFSFAGIAPHRPCLHGPSRMRKEGGATIPETLMKPKTVGHLNGCHRRNHASWRMQMSTRWKVSTLMATIAAAVLALVVSFAQAASNSEQVVFSGTGF